MTTANDLRKAEWHYQENLGEAEWRYQRISPIIDELTEAEAHWQQASACAEKAREERNRLVREALDAGWTHAQIADATGLSRGRIGQIAQRG